MAASACVSTSCSSISGARESYGRVQKLERSGFCGKRVTVGSLAAGAQQWLLPSTTARAVSKSSRSKRSLIITSVLAEISSQTMVSAQSHSNTHTHTHTHTRPPLLFSFNSVQWEGGCCLQVFHIEADLLRKIWKKKMI
jgi:hypothetical protein